MINRNKLSEYYLRSVILILSTESGRYYIAWGVFRDTNYIMKKKKIKKRIKDRDISLNKIIGHNDSDM